MDINFVAGFVSGVAGLVIGSPLDIIKTNHQSSIDATSRVSIRSPGTWFSGLLLPTLGLGFLNAILFWAYGLVLSLASDNNHQASRTPGTLWVSFVGGLFSGVCVCVISVPTELVKVRAQVTESSSIRVVRNIVRTEGPRGFLNGALITILRDAIGYGFYFLTYDGLLLLLDSWDVNKTGSVLLAGGLAGCISWFSIFPLDTIKTRLQGTEEDVQSCLLRHDGGIDPVKSRDLSQLGRIVVCARQIYREGSVGAFFRGLQVAMLRAFVVNAVIFYVDDLVRDLSEIR